MRNILDRDDRPWGEWVDIENFEHLPYRVKRITVNPGQKLSVQYHYHRSEVWVAVSGEGIISISDNAMKTPDDEYALSRHTLREGSHRYIPRQHVHTVEVSDQAEVPLVFIEVQYGNSTEEDIVRLEDIYGRK